jgi:hypothetical protein
MSPEIAHCLTKLTAFVRGSAASCGKIRAVARVCTGRAGCRPASCAGGMPSRLRATFETSAAFGDMSPCTRDLRARVHRGSARNRFNVLRVGQHVLQWAGIAHDAHEAARWIVAQPCGCGTVAQTIALVELDASARAIRT